jgi:hypothetical protein
MKTTLRKLTEAWPLAICLLLPTLTHADVTVDDFSTTQVISGLGLSGSGYVSGPGILGTERDAEAYAPNIDINSTVPGQFLVSNAHPVNWGTVWLTYDGVDHNTSGSYLGGLGHVDLTQGGLNDRFRIPVTAATNRGGSLSITVRNINRYGSTISVPLPSSPEVLALPFASFQLRPGDLYPVNFADVGYIQVSLGLYPGESYSFDMVVATVPEPSMATLLLLAGSAALYGRGRAGTGHAFRNRC